MKGSTDDSLVYKWDLKKALLSQCFRVCYQIITYLQHDGTVHRWDEWTLFSESLKARQLVLHNCSNGPLFRRAHCLLHSFQDEHERREMAALLGCLKGFMTSIYLYRLTQTLTLTFTNLCLIITLTLTSIHTLALNMVPHRCSVRPMRVDQWAGGTMGQQNNGPAEQWVGPRQLSAVVNLHWTELRWLKAVPVCHFIL